MKYIILSLLVTLVHNTIAQDIRGFKSINKDSIPELHWVAANLKDSLEIKIFRSPVDSMEFREIQTFSHIKYSNDSAYFMVMDTTLQRKSLCKYFIQTSIDDKIVRSEILYGHNMGNIPPPGLVRFKARSAEDKKALVLTWKLNYKFTVKSLSLYRSENYDSGYEFVANLPADAETYTDRVEISNEAYYYFIQIHDFFGYLMPSVRIHGICTYKEMAYPPENFNVSINDDKVLITWERVGRNVKGTKIYRRIGNTGRFYPITTTIPTPNRENAYTDTTINSPGRKEVQYYAVNISDGFLESNPTDTISIMSLGKSVVGPPKEVSYILDSLDRIMLIWDSQDGDPNVKGYNVYRSVNEGTPERLNAGLLSYSSNFFTDSSLQDYGRITYFIETVSITNTPSKIRKSINVQRNQPRLHLVLNLRSEKNGISVSWIPLKDKNMKNLLIYRQSGSDAPVLLSRLSPDTNRFMDSGAVSGNIYTYIVVAKLINGGELVVNDGVSMSYLK